jgi:DNA/RNA-binding domain of Phe-tRNA-synthetase-like protein
VSAPDFFSISAAYREAYPGLAFGWTLIADCRNPDNPPGFDEVKRQLLRKMRKRETLAALTARIETYDRFFRSFGYDCPLTKHLKRTVNSGFPRYNLVVDAHFIAEMCAGILVAAADFDRFEGALTLDVAREGETSIGMGRREFKTKDREIVLRDEKEIVCVLCQGADEKTRVSADTRRVLLYAYAVPGIEAEAIREGLMLAADTLGRFGGGGIEGLQVWSNGVLSPAV